MLLLAESTLTFSPAVIIGLGIVMLCLVVAFAAHEYGWVSWLRNRATQDTGPEPQEDIALAPSDRGSDDPPPPGALAWATDIADSMSAASDSSKLKAILDGCTRNQAKDQRIQEQEAERAERMQRQHAGDETAYHETQPRTKSELKALKEAADSLSGGSDK